MTQDQANAWLAVCRQLQAHNPKSFGGPGSGQDCAINEIKRLQALDPRVLLPCPFCGGEPEIQRAGTPKQSTVIVCTQCGCKHESPDEDEMVGSSWNNRVEIE